MKNKYNLTLLSLLASVLLLTASCKKDDEGSSSTDTDGSDSVAQYYSLGIVMPDYTNYLLSTDDITSGSISPVKTGIEIPSGELLQSGDYFYFFSRTDKKFYQYKLNADGSAKEEAALLLTQYITDRAYSQNIVDENTILIMDPVQWGEPAVKWVTISIPDFVVKESGTFNLPTFEKTAGVNWNVNVGRGALHGDKFIFGTIYYDFDGNYAEGTHAIVIDYPSMTNPTMIESLETTAEMGIFTNTSIISTETGDLYLAAYRGAYGVTSDDDIFGSIFRIKKGESDFDDTYFFDLSAKLGSPTQIMQLDFLEGETGMGMLFNPNDVADWSDLDNDHYTFAKIDLPNQSISKFNVPKAGVRLARKPLVHDGNYITYHKLVGAGTNNILTIDYNGGADAYTIGKTIDGQGADGYSVVKHPTK